MRTAATARNEAEATCNDDNGEGEPTVHRRTPFSLGFNVQAKRPYVVNPPQRPRRGLFGLGPRCEAVRACAPMLDCGLTSTIRCSDPRALAIRWSEQAPG
jgi:hypothetical protein